MLALVAVVSTAFVILILGLMSLVRADPEDIPGPAASGRTVLPARSQKPGKSHDSNGT